MTPFIKIIRSYILYAFPFVLACVTWQSFVPKPSIGSGVLPILWEVLSWNFLLWFFVCLCCIFALAFSAEFREQILPKVIGFSEKDEREIQLTGQTARNTLLSTMSLVFLLLFLTSIRVSYQDLKPENRIDGKTRSLCISLTAQLFDQDEIKKWKDNSFTLPASKQSLLLLLLVWQFGTFGYLSRSRRENF